MQYRCSADATAAAVTAARCRRPRPFPAPLRARRNPGGRTRRGRCRSALLTVVGCAGGLGEEVDRLGDDLDTVALGAVLVGPLGVVEAALDRDLRALADVFADVGAEAVEAGDLVPLGFLLGLAAGGVLATLGGDRDRGDVAAVGGAGDGIGADVADKNDDVGHGDFS